MTENLEIRDSTPADLAEIDSFYPLAFPGEDLLPLVQDLLAEPDCVTSLVAEIDGSVVGHAIFTDCGIGGAKDRASLLGPLAVTPARHGQGIGSALIHAGLHRLKDAGVGTVLVLGDPAYYGRFGFETESSIKAPYQLPAEWATAWQSQTLGDAEAPKPGKLLVPAQWQDPALWT